MASSIIELNLRRLRHFGGVTQATIAERAGISLTAYRKIESGRSQPRVRTLQAIASGLEARIQDLVAPSRELTQVRFRSHKHLRSRDKILDDVARWLADFSELEDMLGDTVENRLPALSFNGSQASHRPVWAAEQVRERFGIGQDEPIRDICGLLEAHGIKVGTEPLRSDGFFGLSVAPHGGGPAIVVNTCDRITVERWIFTAAHELGHLVLHLSDYDVLQTNECQDHEKEADAFAAAFLMPDGEFCKEWDKTWGAPILDRVFKVKRIFRVSYRTVLRRLSDRQMIKGNVWAIFQSNYKQRHSGSQLGSNEPDALAGDDFRASFSGDRLSRLVRMAIEDGRISLGRGAEIMRRSLEDMRAASEFWVS
jgi:Zn-dependent peptidase ImmA (M78 family)/transcriptional regulator with XRE-family HTH domain